VRIWEGRHYPIIPLSNCEAIADNLVWTLLSQYLMKSVAYVLLPAFVASVVVFAEDQRPENPAAAQFRKHLEDADTNKDGRVTREELAAEVAKDKNRDQQTIDEIVSRMFSDLDTDNDGTISKAEVAAGAHKVAEHAVVEDDVRRAQQIMNAIAEYKNEHRGARPGNLDELVKLGLIAQAALVCTVADGGKRAWGYKENYEGETAVSLASPTPVDSDGQWIVGLNDGRVLGLHDDTLTLDTILGRNMHIYTGK
jgi:EF hand domain-containing protein